jgi:hypothetical protein
MHLGLIKFLSVELRKKKSIKELIYFFKQIGIQYGKELIRQYKTLFLEFDSDYRQQKKQYEHQNQIKKDLQRALKMLQYIDRKMMQIGKSRTERRQFWRDFYKNAQVRNEVFEDLNKEIK